MWCGGFIWDVHIFMVCVYLFICETVMYEIIDFQYVRSKLSKERNGTCTTHTH